MIKICGHCKKEKTLAEFGRMRSSKDGLRCECRECRKRHWKKPEEDIEKWKSWRKEHMKKLGLSSKGRKVSESTKRKKEQTDCLRWKQHDYCLSVKKKSFSHYKRKGFDGSLEEFLNIVTSNCHYCNCEPDRIICASRNTKHRVGYFKQLGIDRVNNEKGYSKDNIVPCCFRCNNAKFTYSLESFKEWIKKVYENFESKGVGDKMP